MKSLKKIKMATCEICGKETENRWIVKVDNSELKACSDCKSHGKVIRKIKKKRKKPKKKKKTKKKKSNRKKKRKKKELAEGYGEKVKKAREKAGMKQEELAKKIKEKESRIRKIEKEGIMPSEATIRKLEEELEIGLYEKTKDIDTKEYKSKKKNKKVTIGDVIELKKG